MPTFEFKILSLITYQQTEEDGDEVFLKHNKKKIWPANERYAKLRGSKPPQIGHAIPLDKMESGVTIELWEYDNIFSSKQIGSFEVKTDKTGGPFNTELKLTSDEKAIYSLVWEMNEK